MGKYFVVEVKCGVNYVGPGVGIVNTTVKYTKDGVTKWITNSEAEGLANFYLTDVDVYDRLMEEGLSDELTEVMEKSFINEFDGIELSSDYDELEDILLEASDNDAAALIEYIVELTRCPMEEVDGLIELATGKNIDEIVINDDEEDFSKMDEEELFKHRMYREAFLEAETVFKDMDADQEKLCKKALSKIKNLSPEGYDEWKKNYVDSEYEKIKGVEFLTCDYMFAGIGSYCDTFPAEQLESFKCWIKGNGSAFMGEPKPATEEEVRFYIQLNVLQ